LISLLLSSIGDNLRFEDLEVWKRAARLSADIYQAIIGNLKDYGFKDQITRSGLSVPSNIAEGFERLSEKETIAFLSYAKGSAGELRCQIHIGMEIGYIPDHIGSSWINETIELSAMIGGLIKTKKQYMENRLKRAKG
jgi:four helix bundle protein